MPLYKFKSRATGDLILLEPQGRQLLGILGKLDEQKPYQGILLPADMPAAIAALEAAVARDEAERAEQKEQALKEGQSAPPAEGVSLRQRAVPFIDMMKRAHKAEKEIVWGV